MNEQFAKRGIDVLISVSALIALSPILALVWIAIKLEDGGPAVYTSQRVGAGYRLFRLYKFRSMFMDADKRVGEMMAQSQYAASSDDIESAICSECKRLGHPCSPRMMSDEGLVCCESMWNKKHSQDAASCFLKVANDPRVTRVGRFIRKTSIDELPQLINVLKGDMSIVGIRPIPPYEAQALTKDGSIARFMAPAGLTGLWQVTKRGSAAMSAEERIALDNEYALQRTLLGDLKIILKTVPALLQSEDV